MSSGRYRSDYYGSSGQKRKNEFEEPRYRRREFRPYYDDFRRRSSPRSSSRSNSSSSIDDEVGHYHDTILRELGKGTFGAVYKCKDSKHNDHVALKIIRSIERYVESAKIESDILHDIFDQQNAKKVNVCVKMYSRFRFGDHYCMVFETLGISLYDLVKKNDYKRLPLACVRDVARQLLQALDFLKSIRLVHTDLKLENVLFTHSTLRKERVQHAGKTIEVEVPVNTNIKVIDFGGATYEDDRSKARIINTRQYRGPEVTLELGWSYPSDMWSAGCIVAEIYSGDLFFETHDELEHLAMMEHALEDFPLPMVDQSKLGSRYFHRNGRVRTEELSSESWRHVQHMRSLRQHFHLAPEDGDCGIYELTRAMLRIDPAKRVQPTEALQFPFVAPSAVAVGTSTSTTTSTSSTSSGTCEAANVVSSCSESYRSSASTTGS